MAGAFGACMQVLASTLGWTISISIISVKETNIETVFTKNIEMTGFYPTILKCPELGPDIYVTEQVLWHVSSDGGEYK